MRKTYNQIRYASYAESDKAVTLRGSFGDYGGGSEVLIVDVLPFDTTQITSPGNYSVPKWGGCCHPITSGGNPPTVIIKYELSENDRNDQPRSASRQLQRTGRME